MATDQTAHCYNIIDINLIRFILQLAKGFRKLASPEFSKSILSAFQTTMNKKGLLSENTSIMLNFVLMLNIVK